MDDAILDRYNYDEFVPEKFLPWMRFHESPAVGQPAPDFPLWDLDEQKTNLDEIWSNHLYVIVEFGSFT